VHWGDCVCLVWQFSLCKFVWRTRGALLSSVALPVWRRLRVVVVVVVLVVIIIWHDNNSEFIVIRGAGAVVLWCGSPPNHGRGSKLPVRRVSAASL
jgi:hypothetical protein